MGKELVGQEGVPSQSLSTLLDVSMATWHPEIFFYFLACPPEGDDVPYVPLCTLFERSLMVIGSLGCGTETAR